MGTWNLDIKGAMGVKGAFRWRSFRRRLRLAAPIRVTKVGPDGPKALHGPIVTRPAWPCGNARTLNIPLIAGACRLGATPGQEFIDQHQSRAHGDEGVGEVEDGK